MEEKIDVILDTNIIIYAMDGQEKYVHVIEENGLLGISVLSYMELLIGASDAEEESRIISSIFDINIIPLSQNIAFSASHSLREKNQKNLRSTQFADTVIGYTALSLSVPLITNNPKDFTQFENLELVTP